MKKKKRRFPNVLIVVFVLVTVPVSFGALIDFTGGTATLWDTSTVTPNGSIVAESVDYYEEAGFKLDFLETDHFKPSTCIIGDYYDSGNDVIHGHWTSGDFGNLNEIKVTQTNGNSFDLNYFTLTSNTVSAGGAATGSEQTWIHASTDGISISYSQLLPTEDWGLPGANPQISLGSQFDNIMWFSFTTTNAVACFGMDNFYINEVPEPATLILLTSGVMLLGKRKKKSSGCSAKLKDISADIKANKNKYFKQEI